MCLITTSSLHPPWMGKYACWRSNSYLRPTSQRITPTTRTTNKMPTQTPALKIPPTTRQLSKLITNAIAKSPNNEYCFMSSSFCGIMQKVCRLWTGLILWMRDFYEPREHSALNFSYGAHWYVGKRIEHCGSYVTVKAQIPFGGFLYLIWIVYLMEFI